MPQRPGPTARSSSRSSKRSDPPGDDPSAIAVGEIVAAHALHGAVRIRAYQPPAPSIAAGRTVTLAGRGATRTVRVVAVSRHGPRLLLATLEGVTDRNAAEALVGSRILVPVADLPPPGHDEFYYHELEGFRVDTTDGRTLGAIAETFATGANDVWVVRDGGREYLIPVIADVVRTIDRPGARVVIEPLPGLLE